MVSNLTNRFLIGLILIIIVLTSYFFNLDILLISGLVILITYDLIYINLINKLILIFLAIISVLSFFLISYEIFRNIYIFEIILILSTFFFKNFTRLSFTLSLYIFCIILFCIISEDRNLFYLIILISFFNDTIAYIFGRSLGGPLIVPYISPKKTWSGTSISFLATTFLLFFFNFNIFLSMCISIFLFLGDIFFSYIKRYLNLKDFSIILKSHGGILDRLDSMFFVAIIFQFSLIYIL